MKLTKYTKLEFAKIVFIGILPNTTDRAKWNNLCESSKEFIYDLSEFLAKPFVFLTFPLAFPLIVWLLWRNYSKKYDKC